MFQQGFYNNSEPKKITLRNPCLPRVASRRLAASCLPFVEIKLILAESAEGGREMAKITAHVGRITKIVDCIRIVFGLPYNYKLNLSLKMI